MSNTNEGDPPLPTWPHMPLDLPATELSERLEWVERELTQLSSPPGVASRLNGLHYAKAELLTVMLLQRLIGQSRTTRSGQQRLGEDS